LIGNGSTNLVEPCLRDCVRLRTHGCDNCSPPSFSSRPPSARTRCWHVSYGDTIEETARSTGIPPATIYRWQNEQRPEFYDAMLRAARMRFRLSHPPGYDERPRVPGRKDCPACGFAVVIRIT
jgi:hypothetical protein